MGSRLLFGTKTKLGSQVVQLKHKGIWLSKADEKTINGQIAQAKACVTNTITAINGGRINTLATRMAKEYFLTATPSQAQWNELVRILELTKGGLATDFTLKLKGDGNFGFVRQHGVEASDPHAFLEDGEHWSTHGHSIHVSKKRMLKSAELGIVTIIHEATHKYAYTLDHDDRGYRHSDDSGYWKPGLTPEEAFKNADSIAYFAYRVGSAIML